jgi:Helitron helicase-like domain at N-terminus
VLPSSFNVSPQYLQQQFQDAMCMVVKKGPPDLLITFTAIPNWPKIRSGLFEGQSPTNRPNIITQVFALKVKELIFDIMYREIFGFEAWLGYRIEFQKRVLHHMHLLVILKESKNLHGNVSKID